MFKKTENLVFDRKSIFHLFIPLLIDQLMMSFMGLVDSAMVSSVGEAAVSGVSLSDSLGGMLTTVFSAIGTGGTVIVAQYFGKNDRENANRAMKQAITFATFLATFTMLICVVFNGKLLTLMYGEIDPLVYESATAYLPVIAVSYPFVAFRAVIFGALRAVGNTKAAMYISVFINVLNIGGNALFIYGLDMKAAGAGLSTLIVRIIGAILCFYILYRGATSLSLSGYSPFRINYKLIQSILRVAMPVAIETLLFTLGAVIYKRFANMLGTSELTAHTIGFQLNNFLGIPGNALCSTMVIIPGQLMGKQNIEETKYQTRRFIGITMLCFSFTYVAGYFCTDLFAALYHLSAPSTECLRTVMFILMVTMPIIWPSGFIIPSTLRSAGDGKFTMYVSVVSMWGARVALGYLLAIPLGLGLVGLWVAMAMDWLSRGIAFSLRLAGNKWYANKLI